MLISETHFTNRTYFKVPGDNFYHTMHPDGTAHGRAAILVKTNIKHHEHGAFSSEHIQATAIKIENRESPMVLAKVCSPPKHNIKKEQYLDFFSSLGKRFRLLEITMPRIHILGIGALESHSPKAEI